MKRIIKHLSIILSIGIIFTTIGIINLTAYSDTLCEYVVIESVEPTCTENGYKIYKCNDCGNTYTENISARHTAIFKGLEYNKLSYSCKNCSEWYTISIEDALKMFNENTINNNSDGFADINLVNDGIINAKDYAKIKHIQNFELDENAPTSGDKDLNKDDEFSID